jgi:putative phage-type endonuclease
MNREQWLDERKKGIGGSDAAAILGLSPYKSALQVYLEKIGEYSEELSAERMYWGIQLEEKIALEYQKRNPQWTVTYNVNQVITYHYLDEWCMCTVDAMADNGYCDKVIECKNVSEYTKDAWNGKVPDHYLIQLMHNMYVSSAQLGVLCVLIGGQEWRSFEFEYDEELIDMIIEKEKDFWENNVMKRIPPAPQGASSAMLTRIYKHSNGTELVVADDSIGQAIKAYHAANKAKKEHEKAEEDSKAIIQAHLGLSAKGIYIDEPEKIAYAVSWSNVKGREAFDAKTFQAEHPELYAKYVKEGPGYRRFAVTVKDIDKIKLLGGK